MGCGASRSRAATAWSSPASARRASRSKTYLGDRMLGYFDRVFDGRELVVLGYMRQRIPSNWKLMFENIKDPYHASLLHVFLVTFGLFRLDQQSAVEMDDTGRHAVLVSRSGEQEQRSDRTDARVRAELRAARPASAGPGARVPRRRHGGHADDLAQPDRAAAIEHAGDAPDRAVDARSFDLAWTFFGYADDTPEMRQRRLRQANLMGPAGFVSLDDSEAMMLSQAGHRSERRRDVPGRDGRPRGDQRAAHGDGDRDPRVLPALPLRHGAVTRRDRRRTRAGRCGELRARLADLYCAYDNALNDGELERWPELFVDACVYKVIPRENHEQGFPVALIYCESRNMLVDRVVALRETALYAPRIVRRMTGDVCLRAIEDDGLRLTANFVLFQTCPTDRRELFLCGRYLDRVVDDGGVLRFAERLCIYDSTIVPTSLVYPV